MQYCNFTQSKSILEKMIIVIVTGKLVTKVMVSGNGSYGQRKDHRCPPALHTDTVLLKNHIHIHMHTRTHTDTLCVYCECIL